MAFTIRCLTWMNHYMRNKCVKGARETDIENNAKSDLNTWRAQVFLETRTRRTQRCGSTRRLSCLNLQRKSLLKHRNTLVMKKPLVMTSGVCAVDQTCSCGALRSCTQHTAAAMLFTIVRRASGSTRHHETCRASQTHGWGSHSPLADPIRFLEDLSSTGRKPGWSEHSERERTLLMHLWHKQTCFIQTESVTAVVLVLNLRRSVWWIWVHLILLHHTSAKNPSETQRAVSVHSRAVRYWKSGLYTHYIDKSFITESCSKRTHFIT